MQIEFASRDDQIQWEEETPPVTDCNFVKHTKARKHQNGQQHYKVRWISGEQSKSLGSAAGTSCSMYCNTAALYCRQAITRKTGGQERKWAPCKPPLLTHFLFVFLPTSLNKQANTYNRVAEYEVKIGWRVKQPTITSSTAARPNCRSN